MIKFFEKKKIYNLKIESGKFYKNINSLIQSEYSDLKWTPDKVYTGFFVNGEFKLSESIGFNPIKFDRHNHTVIFGKYKLENERIEIEANFKLKNRMKTLILFYSIAILCNLIALFNFNKTNILISISLLLLIPLLDRMISKKNLRAGISRFEEYIIEKIQKTQY